MQQNSTLYWLLTDHLGSTAITANSSGSKSGELRYRAYGETRYTWGTTPTTFRFTGQREENTIGLYFYNARWYDPALGRFVQADSIVPEPGNPQSLNRYSYVLNNPLRYVDPSGHYTFEEDPDDPWIYREWDPRVRSRYWYTHPAVQLRTVSDAEVLAAITSPLWGAAGAVLVDAALTEVALPAAKTVAGQAVARLAPLAQQVWERGKEAIRLARPDGVRWGPHTGAGPLGEEIAKLFRGGSYTELKLNVETTLYRVWGGSSPELGPWWSRTPPAGPLQAKIDLALPSGNTALNVVKIQVPAGTTIYEGFAERLGGLLGGGNQVFIPWVDPSWVVRTW